MATTRAGRGERAQAGFTLIELVVVLAAIGFVLALALPSLHRLMPGVEARAAARAVAGVMREARSLAIRDNTQIAVRIDIGRRLVSITGGAERTLPPTVAASLLTAASELDSAQSGRIAFFPDGTSTGGRLRLSTAGERIDVVVDWLTGRVSVAP